MKDYNSFNKVEDISNKMSDNWPAFYVNYLTGTACIRNSWLCIKDSKCLFIMLIDSNVLIFD